MKTLLGMPEWHRKKCNINRRKQSPLVIVDGKELDRIVEQRVREEIKRVLTANEAKSTPTNNIHKVIGRE